MSTLPCQSTTFQLARGCCSVIPVSPSLDAACLDSAAEAFPSRELDPSPDRADRLPARRATGATSQNSSKGCRRGEAPCRGPLAVVRPGQGLRGGTANALSKAQDHHEEQTDHEADDADRPEHRD